MPSSSDGSRPSMAAKAGLHWMTSTLPSSWTRLTTMPTGAEENAVSKSERAAASSRATRSRSVTSSDTPPIPTIRSSASRTGNFSDQTWRALPVRASGTVSSKLMSSPLLQHLAIVGREMRGDLRRNGVREPVAEQLLGRLAEDAAGLGVGHDPALVGVAHVDRHGAVVENRLQPAAGIRELRLGRLLRRDVARRHRGSGDAAVAHDRAEGRFVDRLAVEGAPAGT